jgi:hypothetical protein
MKKLLRLRLFFIIYFTIKIIVDIVDGCQVASESFGFLNMSPTNVYIYSIGINLLFFALGLLLFHLLLKGRNCARVVLIIIGWLAVLDFIFGLLLSSKVGEFLASIYPLENWNTLILIDRIADLLSFIFWSYAIYILEFNGEIKRMFLSDDDGESNDGQYEH